MNKLGLSQNRNIIPFSKNHVKKVPGICKSSKFPELFTGFILGKIYFETAHFCYNYYLTNEYMLYIMQLQQRKT